MAQTQVTRATNSGAVRTTPGTITHSFGTAATRHKCRLWGRSCHQSAYARPSTRSACVDSCSQLNLRNGCNSITTRKARFRQTRMRLPLTQYVWLNSWRGAELGTIRVNADLSTSRRSLWRLASNGLPDSEKILCGRHTRITCGAVGQHVASIDIRVDRPGTRSKRNYGAGSSAYHGNGGHSTNSRDTFE